MLLTFVVIYLLILGNHNFCDPGEDLVKQGDRWDRLSIVIAGHGEHRMGLVIRHWDDIDKLAGTYWGPRNSRYMCTHNVADKTCQGLGNYG